MYTGHAAYGAVVKYVWSAAIPRSRKCGINLREEYQEFRILKVRSTELLLAVVEALPRQSRGSAQATVTDTKHIRAA